MPVTDSWTGAVWATPAAREHLVPPQRPVNRQEDGPALVRAAFKLLAARTADPQPEGERLDLALTEADLSHMDDHDRLELNMLINSGRAHRVIVHLHHEVSGA